jgi:hypothetical protein
VSFFCCDVAIVCVCVGGGGMVWPIQNQEIKSLKEAGVSVVGSPAKIGSKMFEFFKYHAMVE